MPPLASPHKCVLLLGLCACTARPRAPSVQPRERPPLLDMGALLARSPTNLEITWEPAGEALHLAELLTLADGWAGEPTTMTQLGAALVDGVADASLGEDLVDALEAEPAEERLAYGAGALDYLDLFGSDDLSDTAGLCQEPAVDLAFSEDGADWEARLDITRYLQYVGPLQPLSMTLSEACTAGIAAAAGDVDAAEDADACTSAELHAFFPDDGACRSCVTANGGDVSACVGSEDCVESAWQVARIDGHWYEMASTWIWACAPDIVSPVYLGVKDIGDDGSFPAWWDHEAWGWQCLPFDHDGEISAYCLQDTTGYELPDTVGEGVMGRLAYLRAAGDTGTPHADRIYYASSLTLDSGVRLDRFFVETSGIGIVSYPVTYSDTNGDGVVDGHDWGSWSGGWGFTPGELRPDGSDPTDVDDTFARDFLAGVVLKTATTRPGVPINPINFTRCSSWEGPAADGTWTCVQNDWPTLYYNNDTHVFYPDARLNKVVAIPMITLGSTGEPDPELPGGFVPHIAGTESLANADWEGCDWPDTFAPDHMRTEDQPWDFDSYPSLDADTWNFGGHPERDLRVVLATNQIRGFCPEGE